MNATHILLVEELLNKHSDFLLALILQLTLFSGFVSYQMVRDAYDGMFSTFLSTFPQLTSCYYLHMALSTYHLRLSHFSLQQYNNWITTFNCSKLDGPIIFLFIFLNFTCYVDIFIMCINFN